MTGNQKESRFIRYIGPPDIHDGHILHFQEQDDRVLVFIRGFSQLHFALEFCGVTELKANHPEGMMLYALDEYSADPPLRQFVFANWDDKDDRSLQILGKEFRIVEDAGQHEQQKIKKCSRCGTLFVTRTMAARYCPPCRPEARRERQRLQKQKQQENKK